MAIVRRRSKLTGQFLSLYPAGYSTTYVKATQVYAGQDAHEAYDPANSLTGNWVGTEWQTESAVTDQRYHVDLGSMKVIGRIYYENSHISGTNTDAGAKNFILQGSNSASSFGELTYATNTGWTQITTGQFAQHAAANSPDPKYILVPLHQAYRYFAVKIADNWGEATYMGLRRIALQEMY